MTHPRGARRGMSRRSFLKTSLGSAALLPSASAILAACAKPGSTPGGSRERVLARPDQPVTLPLFRDPIPTDTPMETGTLRVYNWSDYFYKRVLREFEEQYDVTVEWTTFNNMEEGIQKLVAGQVQADVFFPTTDYLARLVERDLLQPLNHDLIPNVPANFWPAFSDPGPYYDVGWRYSVPYVIFTTGVAYRTGSRRRRGGGGGGYELLFDPRFNGEVELLRLLPRRARDDAAPQRRDGRELRRRGRDRRGEGRDPRADQRERGAAHDQRRLRPAARRASSPSRSPGRATSSAASTISRRTCRSTSSATGTRPTTGADRQRPDRDPGDGRKPPPRPRVPELPRATRSGGTSTSATGTAISHR